MTTKNEGSGRVRQRGGGEGRRRGKYGLIGIVATLAVLVLMPARANAACEVPETPNGIPEDAAFNLDVGGTRAALARAGIGIGGAYYAEPFYNWGGFDEGGEYQGVLELYVNADMEKLGFWKGLCFHANGFQIHGNPSRGRISARLCR